MPVKNQIYTVAIDGYSSEGMGVARIDGMVVFVKGAIAGESCAVKILKVTKNAAYGKIERILDASPERQSSPCPYFGKCGGCDFWHMTYQEELRHKKQRVQDALSRIGGIDCPVSKITGADSVEGYRNKAQYQVAKAGENAVYGFYRARSHDLISIDRCLIQNPRSDLAAKTGIEWMNRWQISAYDEEKQTGLIRNIFIRHGFGTGQMMACIVANGKKLPHTHDLIDTLQGACPELSAIVLGANEKAGNSILGDEFITLWNAGYIEDTLCGLSFKLSPRSFYQINRDQAQRLYDRAVALAKPSDCGTVLDLYCGTGTITLALAKAAPETKVIGAEIVSAAVSDAGENALRNGILNAEFILADAEEAAKSLLKKGTLPGAIVVDPPRKGLSPGVVESIGKMSPKRLVYISCDPATLARDVKLLASCGYEAKIAEAFDLFPRCAHVESVVLMERAL